MNALHRAPTGDRRQLFPRVCSGEAFADRLASECNWSTGVPDSTFRQVLPHLEPYRSAPRENHAVAMAFGARVGGLRPCVLLQNSGLGLCADALIGLQQLYRVGTILVVSIRGELQWEEVQHQAWGEITGRMLRLLGIECYDLGTLGLEAVSRAAISAFRRDQVAAVLVHRGNIDESD